MRRKAFVHIVLAVGCFALSWFAVAVRGNGTTATRVTVEAREYPWSAVGRLNISGLMSRSYCTATLIGPQTILTAAHCLWNPLTRTWWRPEAVHFIAAYEAGEDGLQTVLTHVAIGDGYQPDGPAPAGNSAADWAIAELAQPLGREAGWLALGDSAGGTGAVPQGDVGELGYRQDHPNALSLDYGCRFVADFAPASRLAWIDCPAIHGESGGPIVAFRPDGPHVVAMTVLAGQRGAVVLTRAVPVASLDDRSRFPVAGQAAANGGHKQGQGPPAGGPIAAQPVATLRDLTAGSSPHSQSPVMATLMRLLAARAAAVSPR